MSFNNLLTWMSARGTGSWSQFRSAVEELVRETEEGTVEHEGMDDVTTGDLPVYQMARLNLQRLGHVEFFTGAEGADWRVVPPALAIHKDRDQWIGILCGARAPDLSARLRCNGIRCETIPASGMPDCIRVVASDRGALEDACKAAGVLFQMDAPAALLAVLPPVDDPRSRVPEEAPPAPGWTVERFSTRRLGWTAQRPSGSGELSYDDLLACQTGLFRFRLKHQRVYYLRWKGKTYRVNAQVGKYAALRRRRGHPLLEYDRSRCVLRVPLICRPPLLLERALILHSGLLPRLHHATGHLEYSVPEKLAVMAAKLLRQEIR
ncbi:hypothetical protein D6833_02370 [Candidatus Parcubacteria bacterium]|nr:MAG: hypothetical protein D6833_02370 [Candidatus Parcubacteria bacterium]